MVGTQLIGAAFWDGFGALHHEFWAGSTFAGVAADVARWFRFNSIFTGRVVRAAVENAKSTAALLHESCFTLRAADAGVLRCLPFNLSILLNVLALRIAIT